MQLVLQTTSTTPETVQNLYSLASARFLRETVSVALERQCRINARPERRGPLTSTGFEVARRPRERRFLVHVTALRRDWP